MSIGNNNTEPEFAVSKTTFLITENEPSSIVVAITDHAAQGLHGV